MQIFGSFTELYNAQAKGGLDVFNEHVQNDHPADHYKSRSDLPKNRHPQHQLDAASGHVPAAENPTEQSADVVEQPVDVVPFRDRVLQHIQPTESDIRRENRDAMTPEEKDELEKTAETAAELIERITREGTYKAKQDR